MNGKLGMLCRGSAHSEKKKMTRTVPAYHFERFDVVSCASCFLFLSLPRSPVYENNLYNSCFRLYVNLTVSYVSATVEAKGLDSVHTFVL